MRKSADLSLLGIACALALGCATSTAERPAAEPAPPAASAARTPEAPAPPANPSVASEAKPPAAAAPNNAMEDDQNYEWLVDENGKEYTTLSYPKTRAHKKLEDGRLLILGGAKLEILAEDEKSYDVKIMRVRPKAERAERPVSMTRPEPTPQELASADASYPPPPPASDRLRLSPFDRGMPTRGHWRNGFDLADLNGDGKLDFMQGPPRKSGDQPRLFLGDGAGGWRAAQVNVPPGQLDYGDLRVADLDGDGVLDIAMGVHLRGVTVLKGDGKGGFVPLPRDSGLDFTVPKIGEPPPTFSSRRIEIVDWNRDGRLDIVAYSEGPVSNLAASQGPSGAVADELKRAEEIAMRGPRIYLNQGNDKWQAVPAPGSARDLFGDDLEIADLDRDGAPDLVLASNLMGRDNLIYLNAPDNGGFAGLPLDVRPRGYVRAVASGDWNSDGQVDLALSYVNFELGVKRNGIDLYYRQADGSWRREPLAAKAGRNVFATLASGDVDGDGHTDLVGVDQDGGMGLFLGDGKGRFTTETSPEAQEPRGRCRGYGLRLADVDGDGADEIFATYADEPVALYDPERCVGNGGVAVFKSGGNP